MGNEVSQESVPEAVPGTNGGGSQPLQPRPGTVPTCLRWPHGGKTAYICGSFTHWQKLAMQWRQTSSSANSTLVQGEWYKVVDLTPVTHQYKFIIDGQWRHDHTAPTVLDNLGNVNNCIQVQANAVPAAEVGDASGKGTKGGGAKDGGSEGDPGVGSARKPGSSHSVARTTSDPYNLGGVGARTPDSYSQDIPARDELLVHHSASLLLPPQLRLLLPHHHGDASTMPLCVQLGHVFCHQHGEYSILAMAHRFRDRSVTQLLYKPTGKPTHVPRRGELGGGLLTTALTIGVGMHAGDEALTTALEGRGPPLSPTGTELRARSKDVVLHSVRLAGTQRQREGGHGNEYVTYLVDSVLLVHGVQTTLRSERRYKHFNLLDQLLRKEFGPLVPQALPAKRAFGNLHPSFVEERRVALERYLQQCVAIPALAASSLFCYFVEADAQHGAEFGEDETALHQSLHRVCTKQGHLYKKGRRVPSWKRRYFCLCDGELFYYYAAEMSNPFQPLGVISISGGSSPSASVRAFGKSDSGAELSSGAHYGAHYGATAPDGGAGAAAPAHASAHHGGAGAAVAHGSGGGGTNGGRESSHSAVMSNGAGARPTPLIIQPHGEGENSLARHYSFAVHTSNRTYHLASDSARERDDWIRVLCACGAQLSASSSAVAPPSSPLPVATAATAGGGVSTHARQSEVIKVPSSSASAAEDATSRGTELSGLLYKRASKVHIAQRSEAETGQARDWVARHFRLRDEGTIVYYQNADDPPQHARGIVPLSGFDRVEQATPPSDNLPYAFRLTARDGAPDGGVVLAAPTEEERNLWIIHLSSALGAARAARDGADGATSKLSGALEKTSLS